MIAHNRVVLTAEDRAAVDRVMASGQIGQGPEVAAFEEELAARFRPGGAAACVSSGTAALRLAAQVYDAAIWNVPTYACVSLYHALRDEMTVVEPMDCRPSTLDTPAADVIVHTYGVPCSVADDRIEDWTHAPGANLDGRMCGSLGALSVISFGATKPLGCGSGGAVLGPADDIVEIKDIRDYDGKSNLRQRFNYSWHDMGAALGRSRLTRLDADVAERRDRAMRYRAVCREKGIAVQGTDDSTWYRFVMFVPDALKAIEHFREHGVETINPLTTEELIHRQCGLDPEAFPNAERAARMTVSLPNWIGMPREDEDAVLAALSSLEVPA